MVTVLIIFLLVSCHHTIVTSLSASISISVRPLSRNVWCKLARSIPPPRLKHGGPLCMVTPSDPLKHGVETDPLEELMGFGEASAEAGSIIQPAQVFDNLADITRQIEERMIARYNGDYKTADRIKDTLYTDFGVTIHDSRGMWESSDGTRGRIQGYTRSYRDRAAPVMPVECSLTAEHIQQQVQHRTELRRQWRYQEADGIRDELAAAGVELNDPANEWATYDGRLTGVRSTDRECYGDCAEE